MNDGRFQPPWPRNALITPFGRADFQQPGPVSDCGVGSYGLPPRPANNGPPDGAQNQVEAWQGSATVAPNMFQHGRKKRKQMSVMEDLDRKAKQIKIPGPFDNRIAGFVKSMEDTRRELQNQIRGVEVIEEASKRYLKDIEQQVKELLVMREKNQEKECLLRQQLLASPVFAAEECLERLRLINVLQYGTTEIILTDEMKVFEKREAETMERIRLYAVYAAELQKRIRERSQIHFTSETILQEKQLKEMKEGEEWKRLTCTIHAQFVEQKNKMTVDQLLEKNKREKDELAEDHMVVRSALMKEVGEAKQLAERLRHELEIRKTNDGAGSGHSPLASTECIVCFHEMDNHGRMRALLSPCHHAGLCIPCAALCWNKNRKCPVCRIDLSQKPQAIPPILYF